MAKWVKKKRQVTIERYELQGSILPKDRALIDLLLRGWSNEKIAKYLGRTEATIKHQFGSIFKKYGIPENLDQRVALASMLTYARFPELVPFHDGDRAEQVGELRADYFVTLRERKSPR